jgi:hypothetical protein
VTEAPLVGETQLPAIEVEDDTRVAVHRIVSLCDHEVTRHPQVRDQRKIAFQRDEQVLTSPPDVVDTTSPQQAGKGGWIGKAHGRGSDELDAADTPSAQLTPEPARDGFDVRKLWHWWSRPTSSGGGPSRS